MKPCLALGMAMCAIANPMRALAQANDSVMILAPTVTTAERSPSPLLSATASVTRIDAGQLVGLPHATLADALRMAPGVALVDFDGLGFDPQLMVRGFYGGGEAEYVVVMVDGQPVNQLQSGLVTWETLPPLESIEAIEIVRGGASALYGDAALGAIINIITRPSVRHAPEWGVSRGSHDSWRATGALGGDFLWRQASLTAELHRTSGFRDHAERKMASAHGDIVLDSSAARRVALSARGHWREFDDPGPLLDSLLAENRSGSDPFFRFDGKRDRGYALRVHGRGTEGRIRTSGSLTGERRITRSVRTIAFDPDFAATTARDLTATTASATLQADVADTRLPGQDELLVGVDASRGWMASTYYEVACGTRAAYATLSGLQCPEQPVPPSQPGRTSAAGDGTRSTVAVFAQYGVRLSPAVRFSLGGRFDWLSDVYTPLPPSMGPILRASHDAFSPKAGLNVRLLRTAAHSGHVYLTASRSFKAPTLDQMFGEAGSNPLLAPQHGINLEGGAYQQSSLGGGAVLSASVSAYQIEMRDELDFDVATLRYVNIGRSRHRGLEAGLRISGVGSAALWLNHTIQSTTARSGTFSGNALKAIPKHVTTAGASMSPLAALDVRAVVSSTRDVFLDDANTLALPSYIRLDAAAAYQLRSIEVFADVRNLFGTRYSTTGFLDPSGTGASYFHPAAGRVVQLGIRSGR